jgi:hypothetical protein
MWATAVPGEGRDPAQTATRTWCAWSSDSGVCATSTIAQADIMIFLQKSPHAMHSEAKRDTSSPEVRENDGSWQALVVTVVCRNAAAECVLSSLFFVAVARSQLFSCCIVIFVYLSMQPVGLWRWRRHARCALRAVPLSTPHSPRHARCWCSRRPRRRSVAGTITKGAQPRCGKTDAAGSVSPLRR